METYKEYLQNEILNLEEELSDLAIRLDEMKLKQQYKTGRIEAYKASLEHLIDHGVDVWVVSMKTPSGTPVIITPWG